jgi:hypothetical protein
MTFIHFYSSTGGKRMSDYHGQMMNLRTTGRRSVAYREGYVAASHAAAEIASEADAEIARLTAERDNLIAQKNELAEDAAFARRQVAAGREALAKIKAGERHVHDGEVYVILLSAERCRDIAARST